MSKVMEIIKALKQFKKSFDLTDSDDFGDVSRRFATRFNPEELAAAGKQATGRDKAFFSRATSDAKQYQIHKKDVEKLGFHKGGVKGKFSRGEEAMNREGFPTMIKTSKYDPKTKTYRKPKKKPPAPKRPEMKHGGVHKSKKHAYAAGGMVKDMKIMKSK